LEQESGAAGPAAEEAPSTEAAGPGGDSSAPPSIPVTLAAVEHVVKSLVRDSSQVALDIAQQGDKWVVNVRVAPDDRGRVIGRNGRVVKALRVLAAALGARENQQVTVDVPNE
jgi:predicted RNA-binding protein YlqC (UPF0109 family)